MRGHGIDVPEYCSELLSVVEHTTGYPLLVVEKNFLEFDSELSLARRGRRFHKLEYSSPYRRYLDHFLVNAAYKILRTWETAPEDRLMPAAELQHLPEDDYRELAEKLPQNLDKRGIETMSRLLYADLVRQLTSFPVDLRVEQEIAQSLPEHSDKQLAYLRQQVRDFLPTLDEEMLSVFPERVYRASTAMNIVFAEEAAKLSGVAPARAFRHHKSRDSAERLLSRLEQIEEPGYLGNRLLTDAWAKELGLEGWYRWVRYKDIQEGE